MPAPHSYRIGTYQFPPNVILRVPFLVAAEKGGDVRAVFGPETDGKSRYLASVCTEQETPLLSGTVLDGIWGQGLLETPRVVAILDELDRPWVLFGPEGDKEGIQDATLLLLSHTFRSALTQARQSFMQVRGSGTPPVSVVAQAAQEAAGGDTEALQAAVDRHWSDALQPAPSRPVSVLEVDVVVPANDQGR